jgi:ribosomal protein S18 acetylase RimI-like enzyme
MTDIPESYNSAQWSKLLHFERIKPRYNSTISNFQTYQKELRDFLVEDALKMQEWAVSSTFLVFDSRNYFRFRRKKDKELILLGYITILNDSIRLDASLKAAFKEKGINYRSLPALKIGRLCVDQRYERRRIGECMLVWAAHRVAHLNQNSACRFITLDAKRHNERAKDSFHFYRKYGFMVLKKKDDATDLQIAQQRSGTTLMYLDLYTIINRVNKG